MIDKCYEGMANIPPQIADPCDGNPTSTDCVQSPIANPYLSLPAGATQTEINAALSSALIYKDSQIATINNQTLKTVGGESLVGTGDIPFPSGGGVIEVTYAELTSLIASSTLVVGQTYLLIDYMTTYILQDEESNQESGVIEQLFLTAVDVNKLHRIAKSKLYPQDIVYYEVTGDIGNGFGTQGSTKGKIYRRIDALRNNDIGTDWRHIKYNINGQYRTFFVAGQGYNNCRNNKITTTRLFYSVVGENFRDNTITDIYNSIIGNYFFENSIGSLSSSTIGDYCQKNNIVTCDETSIATQFIGNNIGRDFKNNIIGQDFQYNNIGRGFEENTIDYSFQYNIIGDWFYSNTIGSNFYSNKIEDGFTSNNLSDNIAYNRYTVDELPTFLYQNQRFIVTDALNPTYLSVVVGGGTTLTSVMRNNVNNTWIVS